MAEEKTKGQQLQDKLTLKIKNSWEGASDADLKDIEALAVQYKTFLNTGKTEREITANLVSRLEKCGFINIDAASDLKAGSKVYQNVRGKALNFAIIGKKPVSEGLRILGAHIDAPRIDIKTNPLYEDTELAFLDTHYYGGILKYQWPTVPLALHGVFFTKDGGKKEVSIGEKDDDPVFTITDLLPHLSQDRMDKKISDFITGEELDILAGSAPYADEKASEKVKLNTLRILNEMFGVTEDGFASAEIEAVPAGKARDVGFDRSMIGAYGHDDRSCAFASLEAALKIAESGAVPEKTAVCMLVDREEIGSLGNTSAHAKNFEDFIAYIIEKSEKNCSIMGLRRSLSASTMLSADVNAAFDPNFPNVFDKKTCSYLGRGIAISKYTGSRGKYGGAEANGEFLHKTLSLFDSKGIRWQFGNLGKVDKGGGGTIALHFARLGIDVLDCGVPVLSMHSPFEVISKIDLWTTYKAFLEFLRHAD